MWLKKKKDISDSGVETISNTSDPLFFSSSPVIELLILPRHTTIWNKDQVIKFWPMGYKWKWWGQPEQVYFKGENVPFFFPFLHLAFWNVDTMVGVSVVITDQGMTLEMEPTWQRNKIKSLGFSYQEASMAAQSECFWKRKQILILFKTLFGVFSWGRGTFYHM